MAESNIVIKRKSSKLQLKAGFVESLIMVLYLFFIAVGLSLDLPSSVNNAVIVAVLISPCVCAAVEFVRAFWGGFCLERKIPHLVCGALFLFLELIINIYEVGVFNKRIAEGLFLIVEVIVLAALLWQDHYLKKRRLERCTLSVSARVVAFVDKWGVRFRLYYSPVYEYTVNGVTYQSYPDEFTNKVPKVGNVEEIRINPDCPTEVVNLKIESRFSERR